MSNPASRAAVRIGCCISGHGFGHACRTIAVIQALSRHIDISCTILTSVPGWLFGTSLTIPHTVHALPTDVGLIQHDALNVDWLASADALNDFYPLSDERIEQAAVMLADCRLVLCDIAPLGIAAARRAGIPSILLENFTWDWMYQGSVGQCPQLTPQIKYLATVFAGADHRIQAAPVCQRVEGTFYVEPIARSLHRPETVRQRLCCEPKQRLVLLTMGGIPSGSQNLINPEMLVQRSEAVFVQVGGVSEDKWTENLRFLTADGPWYHPDLVAAADLVVGKTGYSTVAEALQGNTAYAYLGRSDFRESEVLEAFLDRHLLSWKITPQHLASGQWFDLLSLLPTNDHPMLRSLGGADQVAQYLLNLLNVQPSPIVP